MSPPKQQLFGMPPGAYPSQLAGHHPHPPPPLSAAAPHHPIPPQSGQLNNADLTPKAPYYELPAGMIVPLVKLEDITVGFVVK